MEQRAIWATLLAIGVLAGSASAQAGETSAFRIELPALVGPMPAYGSSGSRTIEFDFGRDFAEVHRLLLVIEATATSITYESCGSWGAPEPCQTVVTQPSFMAVLKSRSGPSPMAVIDGFRSDNPLSRADAFQSRCCEFDLSHLRDGVGRFHFGWNWLAFIPEDTILNFRVPTAEIFGATLIIEATPLAGPPTPLPEPRAALSGACCLLLLGILRSRKSRAGRPAGRPEREPGGAVCRPDGR